MRIRTMFRRRQIVGVVGCVDDHDGTGCKSDRLHRGCVECGALTHSYTIMVEPKTLRRIHAPHCRSTACHASLDKANDQHRRRRTEADWSRMEAADLSLIATGVLPEQYAGKTRAAVRAFLASDAETAVIHGTTPATLQASIATLGLSDSVYAETRDDKAVLRRIGSPVPSS